MSDPIEALRALLLQFSVRTGEFTLASGQRSSYYVDVRKTALSAEGAAYIGELLFEAARRHAPGARGVGGMTLGADPLISAMLVAAHRQGVEWGGVIVRKEAKGHGVTDRLVTAGNLAGSEQLVVVDDVVTTAGSTVEAIEALRERGFRVDHALAVVDREQGGGSRLAQVGVQLHPLFRISELVEPALL